VVSNANSYDWTIHSISSFYFNSIQYCVFSGFRKILDSAGVNNNYSIWVTALLNNKSRASSGDGTKDLWMTPVAVMPIGSASSTNFNTFTYPSASVVNGMVNITFRAIVVDFYKPNLAGKYGTNRYDTHELYVDSVR